MEVKITHLDRVKFAIQSRSHTILCDQPAENGGEDCGMTPPELLLASLGSCAAFYAVQYLKTRNLAETGVEVTVTAEKLKQPARVGNFRVHVVCPVCSHGRTDGRADALRASLPGSQHSACAARDQDRVSYRRGVRAAKLTIPTDSGRALNAMLIVYCEPVFYSLNGKYGKLSCRCLTGKCGTTQLPESRGGVVVHATRGEPPNQGP